MKVLHSTASATTTTGEPLEASTDTWPSDTTPVWLQKPASLRSGSQSRTRNIRFNVSAKVCESRLDTMESGDDRNGTLRIAEAVNKVTLIDVQAPPSKPQVHGKMIDG